MPVMEIWTLKFVTSVMLDETVRVIVAVVTCPGVSTVFCLFHVIVIGPLALDGFQFEVAMLNESETPFPVFLM